jgi:LmbE family N-acetylglucosaminyl deacetylase
MSPPGAREEREARRAEPVAGPGDEAARAAGTVVFFHAHPDDEAIFTGGSMRLLADAGVRVVLVVATRGEEGAGAPGHALAEQRELETRAAAHLLGATAVHFLGYADSGLGPVVAATSFAAAPVDEAAARLEAILRAERATTLVTYDPHGIYGHPDHVQVERVGVWAAAAVSLATRYESTVDREYLHFVETHLVEEAGRALPLGPPDDVGPGSPAALHPSRREADLGLAATFVGLPSVLIDCTVDVRKVLDVKRRAMLAHASQIPPDSSAMRLSPAAFAEVYGFEWYARHGAPGPLDSLR